MNMLDELQIGRPDRAIREHVLQEWRKVLGGERLGDLETMTADFLP